jgi:hypothetical protein
MSAHKNAGVNAVTANANLTRKQIVLQANKQLKSETDALTKAYTNRINKTNASLRKTRKLKKTRKTNLEIQNDETSLIRDTHLLKNIINCENDQKCSFNRQCRTIKFNNKDPPKNLFNSKKELFTGSIGAGSGILKSKFKKLKKNKTRNVKTKKRY